MQKMVLNTTWIGQQETEFKGKWWRLTKRGQSGEDMLIIYSPNAWD